MALSKHRIILILAYLFLIWVLITNLLNVNNNFESLISSSRIFMSVLLSLIIFKNNNIEKYLNLIFIIGLLNGIFVTVQTADFLLGPFLPDFLQYGYLYNKLFNISYIHSIRNGGFMHGLQVSSLLSLIALLIGFLKKKKYIYIWIIFLLIPLIFGSRTVIAISFFFLIYIFAKNKLLLIFVLVTGFYIVDSLPDLTSFYELRIEPLLNIVMTLDFNQDYSAKDTLSVYDKSINLKTFLIGNGMPQYSRLGGNDPLYTRWLFQTGFIGLVLLILLVVANITLGKRSIFVKLILLLVFFTTSIKGELLISAGIFDIFLIFNQAVLSKKN